MHVPFFLIAVFFALLGVAATIAAIVVYITTGKPSHGIHHTYTKTVDNPFNNRDNR